MFKHLRGRQPKGPQWMNEQHEFAKSYYGDWYDHAREIVRVWQGGFVIPKDLQDAEIEIVRPSKPDNLMRKYMSMLSIRSHKNIKVAMHKFTQQERQRVEKLEAFLRAYMDEQERLGRMNPFRALAWNALMFGRAGLMTRYLPGEDGARIQLLDLDPREYFPVRNDDGYLYFTREYYRPRGELAEFFSRIQDDRGYPMHSARIYELAAGGQDADDHRHPLDLLKVVEYWDAEWHAIMIEDYFIDPLRHDYGFVPLVETRFNETPDHNPRWAAAGLLSGVLEDLKIYAALLSKQATGTEQFYYPKMFYVSEDGRVMQVDANAEPGEFVPIMPGTQPIILSPTPNHNVLQLFKDEIVNNISQGTLPQIVYTQDIPNASGFLVSQILSLVKDAIADKQRPLEVAMGLSLGNVLRLMERYAAGQPEGGWTFPIISTDYAHRINDVVTAEDIDGHWHVDVNIKVALPEDKLQKITIYNQMRAVDPVTGEPAWDFETAAIYSGIADDIQDMERAKRARDLEWALARDKELQTLRLEAIKFENAETIQSWARSAAKARKLGKKLNERLAHQSGEEPLVLTPDKWTNPEVLETMANYVRQGKLPHQALMAEADEEKKDQPSPEEERDIEALLDELLGHSAGMAVLPAPGAGKGEQQTSAPDGLTGYEGINSTILPSAMQGARPRQVVDKYQVELEQAEQRRRRGALPAPA